MIPLYANTVNDPRRDVGSYFASVIVYTTDMEISQSASTSGFMIFPARTVVPGIGLELGKPVAVQIERTTDGVLLRSGQLDEESFGATDVEATADFLVSLGERQNSLAQRESMLSEHDLGVLRRLRDLLVSTPETASDSQ